MSEPYLALKVIMMPKDANPMPTMLPGRGQNFLFSTIFGGVLLSYIDQAGAIGAYHEVVSAGGKPPSVVTVAMNRVEFKKPVLVGDVVRFLTRLVRIGRTSITINVQVEVERGQQVLQVTEAEVVYVGVDPNSPERKPLPLLG
jgi:acyl-CoA thioesterase YciA